MADSARAALRLSLLALILAGSEAPPVPMLAIREAAFSPNGDGRHDGASIAVTASGPWSLDVVGHGPIRSDAGRRRLLWDGRVAGLQLPDGPYVLRLRDGTWQTTAAVTIDTVSPAVREGSIDRIDVREGPHGTDYVYALRFVVEDAGVVPEAGFAVTFRNPHIRPEAVARAADGRTFAVEAGLDIATIDTERPSSPVLAVVVTVGDEAGNQARIPCGLSLGADIRIGIGP